MRKVLPPTYFFAAIALCFALHFLFPVHQLLGFPWRLLGLVPLAIGIILNLVSDQMFKKHNTTVKPFQRSSVLITDGVFRLTRNPMYLGMTLILLGVALVLGSATPFAVALLLGLLFDRLFIVQEERMLKNIFPEQFRQYCRRVRRWI